MSVPSKITLGLAAAISTAIIGYVHYKQSEDRLKLHEGVLRDIEQQQRRKHENTYTLQKQIDMTKQLKAMEATTTKPTDQQASPERETEEPEPQTSKKYNQVPPTDAV